MSLNYKNKKYLTVPEQVEKNKDDIYRMISGEITSIDDVMIGTATVYTETAPLSGLRVIDGYYTNEGDKCLVSGLGENTNGIYLIQTDDWIKIQEVTRNQVVSIDYGDIYGGAQLKKAVSGITVIVKNPERIKWRVI